MKRFLYTILVILIISTVNAQEDKNYILRKKIVETQKKIEEYEKKTIETEKEFADFTESHAQRIKKRKNDISNVRTDVKNLENDLKAERSRNASLIRYLRNNEIQFSMLKDALRKKMAASESAIKDFPYNLEERQTNIARLISDSELESIQAQEIFSRYYNFLNRELLTGMDSEVFIKGNIKYLRIGWILLCYSDENNHEEGLLLRKDGKWDWYTDLDFAARKAIRDSIKMVEGKKAPDIISFPVPVSVLKESLKGGDR